MTDLVQRLRDADLESMQRMNGSRIFKEAADEIERLRGAGRILALRVLQSTLSLDDVEAVARDSFLTPNAQAAWPRSGHVGWSDWLGVIRDY